MIKKQIAALFIVLGMLIMCLTPKVALSGAASGIKLCLNTIIPSLFPFMFLINMLISGNLISFDKKGKYSAIITVYLLSATGGYPIGAKIAEELYICGSLDKKSANLLKCFCTHSGPGFIISGVGIGIYKSSKVGFILLLAHLLSSVLISLAIIGKIDFKREKTHIKDILISEMITVSAADSSSAVMSISSMIIVFSVMVQYVNIYLKNARLLKGLSLLLEVTNGVFNAKNLYITAFLISFGGVCVMAQIQSVSRKSGINAVFIVSRVIHGVLTAIFTALFVKLFKINISSAGYIADYSFLTGYNKLFLCFSLLIMIVVLFYSAEAQIRGGNNY